MPGIIVGTDGSAHSRRALEWAIREAGVRRAPLTVVSVYQAIPDYWGDITPAVSTRWLRRPARRPRRRRTAARPGRPRSRPLSVTVQAANGLPAEELLKAADDTDADMIVVGARGAGGFKKPLLGSVGTHVTHHAHCPVAVIPPEEQR